MNRRMVGIDMALTEWVYNNNTGVLVELPTPLAELDLKSGKAWHGPFDSEQAGLDYYNANKQPGWKAPTNNLGQIIKNAGSSITSTVTGAVGNAVTGSIADKFSAWFIRVGEVLLGLILIGVGIAKLTGTTNLIAKTVKAAI